MLKKIFSEQDLPMEDLQRIGLATNSKLILSEENLRALLAGRRTEMLRLENLSGDGVQIPELDAKLSLRPNADRKLDLLVHPIYRTPQFPEYLTDAEAESLENGRAVNIEKTITDPEGMKRSVIAEFDSETREFILTDSERILVPDMVNHEFLSLEQKERYRKGKDVALADGTTFRFSGTDIQAIRANRFALIASIVVDGGLTYALYKGLNALFGKEHHQEKADDYSKGYYADLAALEQQRRPEHALTRHYDDYSHGYSQDNAR